MSQTPASRTPSLAVVVLAAGKGTRMHSDRPKVLHGVAGRPLVRHVLAATAPLAPARTVVVVGPDMAEVAAAVAPAATVVQADQRGTGDAVLAARAALADYDGAVLVIYGDCPLIQAETLQRLVDARRQRAETGLAVLAFEPADPSPYGRLILGADGNLERIVEARDAGPEERAVRLCNAGPLAAPRALLFELLAAVGNDNAKGEYYLTDAAGLARARGLPVVVETAPETEVMGVNSRAELAAAEAAMQDRLRGAALDAGVTLVAPETVWLAADTAFGRDVVVEPHVVFGPGVEVGDNVAIRAFSHLEGVVIEDGASVGPFARLRPGTRLGQGVRIGNFVEVKNAVLEAGAKANHLSYVGDSHVGARANIGAGTITCNYDGFAKARTEIGADAFIGSNTALVAPVKVGDGAIVGAGSVITDDVAKDALAVARGGQKTVARGGAKYRAKRRRETKAKKSTDQEKDR